MLSELRSYITNLRTVRYYNQGDIHDHDDPTYAIDKLVHLGNTILAPLRWENTTFTTRENRRHDSYLLPLELIPTILASIDALNESQSTVVGDSSSAENSNVDRNDVSHIRSSDDFLSTIFASYTVDDDFSNYIKKFARTVRADALLPLLSLAMDDIGFGRMSMVLPNVDRVTYWDCLKFALNDVIHANLICYAIEANSVLQEKIVEEASRDDGIHIIPLSDYPALMRCLFRIIDLSTSASSHASIGLSWESIFLRLYHAAAVATSRTPLDSMHRRKNPRDADRLSLLSTIESHVLLPSCTGASVSTITSILDACGRDCCTLCKRDAADGHMVPSYCDSAIPSWVIAGVVLVIMRARSSNVSHSAKSTSFGPRIVFRMASNLMLKRTEETKIKQSYSRGGSDVGSALNVLLRLSTVRKCVCLDCQGIKYSVDTGKHGYDVLRFACYGGHDLFFHRYRETNTLNNSYQVELGFNTLSSISKLVRSSLNHGALHTTEKNQSSTECFVADTAKAWIDAANMLLDDSIQTSINEATTSSIQDGINFAVVIIVVVFFEVPSSQNAIVRSIYDRLVNMKLHMNNGVARKGDQYVFILISILAWSSVSNVRKNSCYGIVQTVGGTVQMDRATSILEPFCNLLSKSALSCDQYLYEKTDVPRLSYWALRMLARALLPISSGRELILALAQKNMTVQPMSSSNRCYTSNATAFFEPIPCSSSSSDALYFAIDCLCALTEKCHPMQASRTDDCGRTAVGMLSDLIIFQQLSSSSKSCTTPRVPIDCVLWTISELNNRACSQKLSSWNSQRFLRVCYVGLLEFISLQEIEVDAPACFDIEIIFSNISTSRSNAGPYITGLLTLAVSLYDEIARFNAVPIASVLLKPSTLRSLLNGTTHLSDAALGSAMNQSEIDQHLREGHAALLQGFNASDKTRGIVVDSVILEILFRAVAQFVTRNHPSSADRVDNDSIRLLKEYILRAERFYYAEEDNAIQRCTSLPTWIKDRQSFINTSPRDMQTALQIDGGLFDCVELKLFQLSLCDILGDILLQDWTQHIGSSNHVLLGLNAVLEYKRRVASKELVLNSLQNSSLCSLLELSAQFLRPILTTSANKRGVLPELETLVLNVLDVCKIDSIQLQCQTSQQCRILSSFASLYGSLCDEESSRLLISFVKESYVELGKWADFTESSFSLLLITSSEDLDCHVRYLREAILTALAHVLSAVSSYPNASSIVERQANLDVLFQLLLQICQDLDASFQGYSGGIHKKLCLVFLDAIDKCIDAIASIFDSMPASEQRQTTISFESVHQACVIIWEIFCDNALHQATVIKATLRLCVDKIPNMLLRVERTVQECILNEQMSELPCDLLDKCSAQLISNPGVPVTDANCENGNCTSKLDDTRVTSADGKPNEGKDSVEVRRAHIIPTILKPATLAWVYNCVFVSLTNVWSDNYLTIAGGTKSKWSTNNVEKSTSLSRRRIEVLSRGLTSMCRLFEEQLGLAERPANADVDSTYSTHLLVELLSHYGKSNVCNNVEKVSNTLTFALRQISKYFRASPHPIVDNRALLNESSLHESLICILGWLRSMKAQETKYNMITGILQWQANEKGSFNISSLDDSDGCYIVGRLPKVLLRIEGLDAELRTLEMLLITRRDKCSSALRLALDERITALSGKGQEANKPESLLQMLQDCIRIIDASKNTLRLNDHVNIQSDDEDSDADIDEDDIIAGGKRRKDHRYGKVRKSRRVSLRSRNDTIDNWLTMDDYEFGSDLGEKYNADDAFVDLEDFIVEG